MSHIGNPIAAGVAQAVHNAQQIARQRDRARTGSVQDARRLHDRIEAHLQAVEEGEDPAAATQIRISDDLPQQSNPQQRDNAPPRPPQETDAAATPDTPAPPPAAAAPRNPLYRHLDVQA